MSAAEAVELADEFLAEFSGKRRTSNISRIDLEKENHARASHCLQGYVTDRLDKMDIGGDEGALSRATRGSSDRRASAPAVGQGPGFKTHIPGIFGKIQDKLDPDVKLIDDDLKDNIVKPISVRRPVITESERKADRKPLSPSYISSNDPIEVADQILAEFEGNTPTVARIGEQEHKQGQAVHRVQDYRSDRSETLTPPPQVISPTRDLTSPTPPINRAVSPGAGFKTHVPGIFGKIQSKVGTKLVADEDKDMVIIHNNVSNTRFRKSSPSSNKPDTEKTPKPGPVYRSSSIPNSDDPVLMADQFLAEFEKPNITPRDNLPKPSPEPRRASHPAMQGSGFKHHVPGIFGKIQAQLDPDVKLVDDDDDDPNGPGNTLQQCGTSGDPERDIMKRLANVEVDGFVNHTPEVFNKIQQKLYFNPDIEHSGDDP